MKNFKNFELTQDEQRNAIGKGKPAWAGKGGRKANDPDFFKGKGAKEGKGKPWDVAGITKEEWIQDKMMNGDDEMEG